MIKKYNLQPVSLLKRFVFNLEVISQRYKFLFISLIVFFGCNWFETKAFAQHHRIEDCYQVSLTDFQGARGNNPFPVYISVEILYKIDSVVKIRKNKFKLKVITMVKIHKDQSFFDLNAIDKQNLPYLLKHEQGHVTISYMAANLIEKDLSAKVYTEDFIAEVKKNFSSASAHYLRLNEVYDEQTNHSRDQSSQERWNENMKVLFKESYKSK